MNIKTIVYSTIDERPDKSNGLGFNYLLDFDPFTIPKKKKYKKRKKKNAS